MKVVYFDTSVLLAILLGDDHKEDGIRLWISSAERVSSELLEIEALTVIRRASLRLPKRELERELEEKEQALSLAISEVSLFSIDSTLLACIRDDRRLSYYRSLDSIHLATALHLSRQTERPFVVASFDKAFLEAAKSVGLGTLSHITSQQLD